MRYKIAGWKKWKKQKNEKNCILKSEIIFMEPSTVKFYLTVRLYVRRLFLPSNFFHGSKFYGWNRQILGFSRFAHTL